MTAVSIFKIIVESISNGSRGVFIYSGTHNIEIIERAKNELLRTYKILEIIQLDEIEVN